MVAVVQRVTEASVTVEGRRRAEIGAGLLVLLGVAKEDGDTQAEELAHKVVHLRIFEDQGGRMNRSVLDIRGSVLIVSQFTLLADTSRGRRPGFEAAAPPEDAEALYNRFVEAVRARGVPALTGMFGARMEVRLTNGGPVTLILQSKSRGRGGGSPEPRRSPAQG